MKDLTRNFILFFFFIINLVTVTVHAGQTGYINYLSKAEITIGSTIVVMDNSYFSEVLTPTLYGVKRINKVRLVWPRVDHNDVVDKEHQGDAHYWTYTIHYSIADFFDPGNFTSQGELTISFDPANSNSRYESMQEIGSSYAAFLIRIDNIEATYYDGNSLVPVITLPSTFALLPEDIRVEAIIETEKYHELDKTLASAVPQINYDNIHGDLYWDYVEGAEAYEVEWTFIDDQDQPPAFSSNEEIFNYKPGVRVSTGFHKYHMLFTYPEGTIYFRIRAIGRYIQGVGEDYSHRKWGEWGYSDYGSSALSLSVGSDYEMYKNWQYTVDYAEDGKYKKAITYYDGMLRSRQSVVTMSTDNTVVVSEMKYDSEGRPALSILPVPLKPTYGSELNYWDNFNRSATGGGTELTPSEYDGAALELSTSYGAGKYYSTNNFTANLSQDPFVANIADADGYPFSQVKYLSDNSGRKSMESGTGEEFKLDGTHQTKYFYCTPNGTELHYLFGTNVGKASHYKKEVAIDPNGQISFNYKDQEGRTIATSLAGENPSNLHVLDENTNLDMTVDLTENNVTDEQAGTVSSTNNIANAVPGTSYDFHYDVNAIMYEYDFPGYEDDDGMNVPQQYICEDCEYTLKLGITDPYGEPVPFTYDGTQYDELNYTINNTGAVNCNTGYYNAPSPVIEFTVNFDHIGDYTVYKVLKLSTTDLETDISANLNTAGVNQDLLDDMITQSETEINYEPCNIITESDLGIGSQAYIDEITSVVSSAATAECQAIYQQMLMDVSPNGGTSGPGFEYAEPTPPTYSGGFWARVVLLTNQNPSPNIPVIQIIFPTYSTTVYYDFTTTLGTTLIPAFLTFVSNPANWDDALWGDQLLKAHREYCHYSDCIEMHDSKVYDAMMSMNMSTTANNWTYADNAGYLVPFPLTNGTLFYSTHSYVTGSGNYDPIYSYMPTGTAAIVEGYMLQDLPGTTQDAWAHSFYNTYVYNGNTADPFMLFRGLYQGYKQEVHSLWLVNSGCPYQTDDNKIVTGSSGVFNVSGGTPSEADINAFTANNSTFWQITEDLCENNVAMWMEQLDDQMQANCNASLSDLSGQQLIDLQAALLAYCESQNGITNPMGLITDGALAGTGDGADYLALIAPILNTLTGCDGDAILGGAFNTSDDIYQYEDPCVEGTMTITRLKPCFYTLVHDDNDLIEQINDVFSGASSSPMSISQPNDCYAAGFSLTIDENNNNIIGLFIPSTNTKVCDFMIFYESNGTIIDMGSIDQIVSVIYQPVSPVNPAPSQLFYEQVEVVLEVNGEPVAAYIYGEFDPENSDLGNPCSLTEQVEQTVPCFTGFDLPGYTMDIPAMETACNDLLIALSGYNAEQQYQDIVSEYSADFAAQNLANCIPPTEHFYYRYQRNEYHYTLYYYDQAGNLVQTVPPGGFDGLELDNPNTPTTVEGAFDAAGVYDGTSEPDHIFKTRYTYNSLNQPIRQITPDGGITNFYYDLKGRLIASRNAKQQEEGDIDDQSIYSYTLYDEQGRIIQVGEGKNPTVGVVLQNIDEDDPEGGFTSWFNNAVKSQVTQTYYDNTAGYTTGMQGAADEFPNTEQQNLRARVAAVTISDSDPANQTTPDAATYYSYDEHGNVNYLVNDNPTLALLGQGNRYKHVSYTYDLISGKVNTVDYQEQYPDEFHHKYYYDADNRLTIAMTSSDGRIWEKDAKYFYYKHGPLARTEIGEDKVQGNDYAYTLQGWLKGVNSNTLDQKRDIGHDGSNINNTWIPNTKNRYISTDAFGFTLGYYDNETLGDYSPISNLKSNATYNTDYYFEASTHNTPLTDPQDFTGCSIIGMNPITSDHNYLYNGNISHMVTAMMNETNGILPTQGNAYEYDQLNRIIATQRYDNYSSTGPDDYVKQNNTWANAVAINQYQERYSYDDETLGDGFGPNGNLMRLSRNDGTGLLIDDLVYHYYDDANSEHTNRLSHVDDAAGTTPIGVDIEPGQSGNNLDNDDNYRYDQIGNLTHDEQEQIETIEWTVYGKIKSITRTLGSIKADLEFAYDPMGNRIMKTVKPRDANGILPLTQWIFTYYSRDAQGNIMAVYDRKITIEEMNPDEFYVNDLMKIAEWNLYGSSRVGVKEGNERSMGGLIFDEPTGFETWTSMYTLNDALDGWVEEGDNDHGYYARNMGQKRYELSNHLGNVMVVIDDIPVGQIAGNPTNNQLTIAEFYYPHIKSYQDYYSFGMQTPDVARSHSSGDYRFGFNGKENDNEVNGQGNEIDFGGRIYDPRLGKWLSMDPKSGLYPGVSPYTYALNTPIEAKDPDGNLVIFINGQHTGDGGTAKYWGAYDKRVMGAIGDHSARYVDGALGGFENTQAVFDKGYESTESWKMFGKSIAAQQAVRVQNGINAIMTESNVNRKVREQAGYAQGVKDAGDVFASLTDGESIKIVTHSMGSAFSRGYINALKEYMKTNNITDHNIELVVDINAFQGGELSAIPGVTTLNKTGGNDGKSIFQSLLYLINTGGISVPGVGKVLGSQDITAPEEQNKSHEISEMGVKGIPFIGNEGTLSKKPVEQGSNNGNQ